MSELGSLAPSWLSDVMWWAQLELSDGPRGARAFGTRLSWFIWTVYIIKTLAPSPVPPQNSRKVYFINDRPVVCYCSKPGLLLFI